MKSLKLLLSTVFVCACLIIGAGFAQAEVVRAEVFAATPTGGGMSYGSVIFIDTADGLEIRLALRGLPGGEHGFHVHEKGDCSPMTAADGKVTPAGGAGGHFDPAKTGKHLGPNAGGHLGDLPVLVTSEMHGQNGVRGVMPVKLKGVKAADFKGRAVMIHAGGDNYSDDPAPLGGGGARIGCGIIQ